MFFFKDVQPPAAPNSLAGAVGKGGVLGLCLPHHLSATPWPENLGPGVSMLDFVMSWGWAGLF